jgi:hypothetical protein
MTKLIVSPKFTKRDLTFDIINSNKGWVQQYSSLDLISFCQLHNYLC